MDTTWATISATSAPWSDYSYEALKTAMLKAEQLLKKCPPTINRVICQRHLCRPQFVKWNKRHRRSRINRKWQKRYGALVRCDGVAYKVEDTLLVCPCAAKHLPAGTVTMDGGRMVRKL